MLQSLRIRNLALLEEVDARFRAGFHGGDGRDGRGQEHPARGAQPAGRRAGGEDRHPAGRGGVRGRGGAVFRRPAQNRRRAGVAGPAAVRGRPCSSSSAACRATRRRRSPSTAAWPRSRRCRRWGSIGSIFTDRANRGGCSRRRRSSNCSISSRRAGAALAAYQETYRAWRALAGGAGEARARDAAVARPDPVSRGPAGEDGPAGADRRRRSRRWNGISSG